jgi:YD repeat-containing protein
MQPELCPLCGSLLSNGVCPHCGATKPPAQAATRPVVGTATQPGSGGIYKAIFIAVVNVLFAVLALYVKVHIQPHQPDRSNNAPTSQRGPGIYQPHDGPVARLSELKGTGRIYLMQVGPHTAPYSLDDFAGWLHNKYSLDVQILPPMAFNPADWNPSRKQYVAELLYQRIEHEHPDLAADPNAYLIGFTDADMYPVYQNWPSTYAERDLLHRAAIISSDGLQGFVPFGVKVAADLRARQLQAKLRRILLKNVAILYWHLPVNNDPTSVLHQPLDYDVPVEDIYESDLDPDRTLWRRSEGPPCLFFTYSAKNGIQPLAGPLIRTCSSVQDPLPDPSVELFVVDPEQGTIFSKHTDFYLPDVIPIQFQRVIGRLWNFPMSFGISGSNNYDDFLWSANNLRNIGVAHAGWGSGDMVRVKSGFFSSMLQDKWVDTYYSGRAYEMRWTATPFEHFDLKSFDGHVETFLSYNNCTPCVEIGLRWISLTYAGSAKNVTQITDNQEHAIQYGYNAHAQLTSVTYPSGEVLTYTYDDAQHLLTFSAAPNAKAAPQLIMRNDYDHGKLARETLADGKTYAYTYNPPALGAPGTTTISTPEGTVYDVAIWNGMSRVRERPAPPILQANRRPKRYAAAEK